MAASAGMDFSDPFARGESVHAPKVMGVPQVAFAGTQAESRRPGGHPPNNQGVVAGKTQRQGQAPAGVAFRVLVVIRRLEPQDDLAHEREIARQGAHCKNERLPGIIPGGCRVAVGFEKSRRQAASSEMLLRASEIRRFSPARFQIHDEDAEGLFHRAFSLELCPPAPTSTISRQS